MKTICLKTCWLIKQKLLVTNVDIQRSLMLKCLQMTDKILSIKYFLKRKVFLHILFFKFLKDRDDLFSTFRKSLCKKEEKSCALKGKAHWSWGGGSEYTVNVFSLNIPYTLFFLIFFYFYFFL